MKPGVKACVTTIFWCGLGLLPVAVHAGAITVANNSFETPSCGACYDPSGASWSFTSTAGILGPGYIGVTPPDGSQEGWLQYYNEGEPVIYQTLTGFTIGDSYDVNFYFALRLADLPGLPFIVTMGSNNLGTFTPTTTTFTNTSTSSFVATATSYVLSFTGDFGTGPYTSETDSVMDLVTVNDLGPGGSAPEPASFILAGSALTLLGLRFVASRRKQQR
jgi:hypothetical protein